ncbi:hypothetical protein AB0I53_02590 [Saccharopolyspora sp. NPDC050389]
MFEKQQYSGIRLLRVLLGGVRALVKSRMVELVADISSHGFRRR